MVLVWSSEVCDVSLWLYAAVVIMPIWATSKLAIVALVLYGAMLSVVWCIWGTLNPRFME